jgi:hypothetical protein
MSLWTNHQEVLCSSNNPRYVGSPTHLRWFALLAQQDEQPAVAEALALIGELASDTGPPCDRR